MTIDFAEAESIEVLDAVKLGEAGIDVPEHLIYYDDDAIADDNAFDGPWKEIDSALEEEANYRNRN